ncbi:diacylglycerol/lipid kinase family protein [Bacillus sp. T33-2]|uniref:diacylglycerol/lipid kinase family protein n=1 Tax=Bacillus sp. T33-2 TaxID=2054168 RepID=UPI000C75DB30|nr:diacylglycerol kinase family protein [Bacillus sp. T33-2]PLR98190.1 diacylglycerol kinase [Bacillus sp. T33-2]
MENIYFIVNPKAKNGHCLKLWKTLETKLQQEQVPYLAFFSEYPGHAKELSESLAKKAGGQKIIIAAVGGDGTAHEVVNGAANYPKVDIACIPGGSGNDFCRGFSIPKQPLLALSLLLEDKKRQSLSIDLGEISGGDSKETYFVNNMGAGFDAVVSKKANESVMKPVFNRISLGRLVYVYILINKLLTYKCTPIEILVDGKKHHFNDTWFVTVSNQVYYGGGMKIAPDASPVDGLLNVTVVHNLSRWKLLIVFMSVFWGGHTRFKEVKKFAGESVAISSSSPLLVHADGEIIGNTPLKIRVCRHALSILAGREFKEERAEEMK